MYEKFWFVLPVYEIALKSSLEGTGNASNKDGLTEAKIAAMFILGLSALTCSVLPIGITKYFTRGRGLSEKGMNYMAVLLRFGGGILLATTFIHLLPEVREGYENLQKIAPDLNNWPGNLPELIMCAGFFMMYGIEEVAHKCLHKSHRHGRQTSGRDCNRQQDDDGHVGENHARNGPLCSDVEACSTDSRRCARSIPSDREENQNDKGHSHVVPSGSPVRGLLIIVALSIHQIFEGLAVGLEEDSSHVWLLLGAVAAHKLVIAFCVGFEIASSHLRFWAATGCVAIFALASPIGIGMGVAVSSGSEPSESIDVASVVLQGFATGTLLFVVFFEVLTKSEVEGDGRSNMGLVRFLAAVVGFIFMAILLYSVAD